MAMAQPCRLPTTSWSSIVFAELATSCSVEQIQLFTTSLYTYLAPPPPGFWAQNFIKHHAPAAARSKFWAKS
eukprot:6470420-Amphidinium_carterae.1